MEEGKQSLIVAQRGRKLLDGKRVENGTYTQQLEYNNTDTTNTLTSVQSDNMVMEIKIKYKDWRQSQDNRVHLTDGLSPALGSSSGCSAPKIEVMQVNPSIESGGKQPYQQNRVYSDKGLAPTIDQAAGRWSIENATNIRRLTMVECERLQGFEDNWTQYGMYPKGKVSQVVFNALSNIDKIDYINTPSIEKAIPKTARYKLCGNAVTKSIVELIANKLISK